MTHRLVLALALSLGAFVLCVAQNQSPSPQPAGSPTRASTPPPSPSPEEKDDVVRITTNLVQVDAVVTKDGKPVSNLTADDFELYEDGKRQAITSFAYISNVSSARAPVSINSDNAVPTSANTTVRPNVPRRTIALVVDDLGLAAESIARVRNQLRKFVNTQLQPNDLIAIIRTGGTMGALQQFTSDKRLLDRALDQVHWNLCSRVGQTVLPPVGRVGGSVTSSLFGPCGTNAAVSATLRSIRFIVDAMKEMPGRKSLVIFSDSLPREEQEIDFDKLGENAPPEGSVDSEHRDLSFLLQRIAEKAIRSSVVIYAVDTSGLQYTGLTAADSVQASSPAQLTNQINSIMSARSSVLLARREGAELIAKETGGFLVRNSNNFELDRISEDQSGYYLIGYRPTEETFDKHFHHIKAKVKRSGMTLRTRFGFYGFTEEEASRNKRTAADATTVALMSPFGARDIDIDLTAFFADDKNRGSVVRVFVYLNAKDLTFTEDAAGWHNASVEFRGMIFGNNGSVVDQVTHGSNLSIKGATYEAALRDGLSIQFDIPVKRPGSYQVRVSARDIASGHIGAVGQFVNIPNLNNHELAVSGIVMRGVATGNGSTDSAAGPALRKFSSGQTVLFSCVIYNATITSLNQANVVMVAKLFRDGKAVYATPEMKVDTNGQTDLTRLVAHGFVRLEPALQPGNYYLQLLLTDKSAQRQSPVMQSIDFEIVK